MKTYMVLHASTVDGQFLTIPTGINWVVEMLVYPMNTAVLFNHPKCLGGLSIRFVFQVL